MSTSSSVVSNARLPGASESGSSRPALWLCAGALLLVLSELRWGAGVLAWIAPVPFLYYLCITQGWRSRFDLLAVLTVANTVVMAKIVTPPISYAIVPLFSLPGAIGAWFIFLVWDGLRRSTGDVWALYALPALVVVSEWAQAYFSELGVWGARANTQLESLPLLQLASLSGMSGIAFLMSWGAALLALLWARRAWRDWRGHIAAFLIVFVAVYMYGSVRLYAMQPGPQVRAAAVATDLIFTGAIPSTEELTRNSEQLFARSETAAARGAQLIVWNEGATLVPKEDEPAFLARGRELAQRHAAHLVLAYIVPVTLKPLTFENKYVWLRPDGAVAEEYFKHHPVPGEGSIKGTAPLAAVETEFGKMAGAICYDYDFPAMAREHARLGAGLVVVPSSDWRGIDPFHTQMTRVRAIEGGFSVLRPVRAAASAGFDAYGRVRGWMNYFEENERIMLVTLPVRRVPTLYSRIGDVLPVLCLVILAVTGGVAWRRRAVARVSIGSL